MTLFDRVLELIHSEKCRDSFEDILICLNRDAGKPLDKAGAYFFVMSSNERRLFSERYEVGKCGNWHLVGMPYSELVLLTCDPEVDKFEILIGSEYTLNSKVRP